jgi:hypothetical protein
MLIFVPLWLVTPFMLRLLPELGSPYQGKARRVLALLDLRLITTCLVNLMVTSS